MQSHQLQRAHPHRKKRQVGRGGKRGKTAGRGTKCQLARAGRKLRPELRDIIKKLPKNRGYRFPSIQTKLMVVNLGEIGKRFEAGNEVTPAALLAKNLLRRRGGQLPAVKILATGALTKALSFSGCFVSAAARAKVEAAGGQVKVND